jgi:hypothetical protein
MIISLAPNETAIYAALRTFFQAVLPAGIEIIRSQDNRVPEPIGPDFVIMRSQEKPRISTNIDTFADAAFTASIAGNVLNVTAVQIGTIGVGAQLFGSGVAANTVISGAVGGTGGVGTYTVSIPQTLGPTAMAAGIETMEQDTEVIVQVDVHGPNAADNAQLITTTFRDDFGVQLFGGPASSIQPLYTDDPLRVPFVNAENQWETRWVIGMHMEANVQVVVPQQFASAVKVNVISVQATYGP